MGFFYFEMSSSLQAYMQNVFQFCFIVVPMMFSLSVFNVITDSMLTKSIPSSDTGEVILLLLLLLAQHAVRKSTITFTTTTTTTAAGTLLPHVITAKRLNLKQKVGKK